MGMTEFLFHRVIPVLTAAIGVLLVVLTAAVAWDILYGHRKDEHNG
jgi:hypothetical protein